MKRGGAVYGCYRVFGADDFGKFGFKFIYEFTYA